MALSACAVPDDSHDEELEFRDFIGGGGGGGGGLLGNGLVDPDVSGLDPAYALTSAEGLSTEALADPALRATAKYAVECALPYGTSITRVVNGKTVVFDGLVGLTPEWETGVCDQDCQEWVSACLLARTNVSGETVQISIKGDHEALNWDAPSGAVLEGAFYGNLFVAPEDRFLCRGSTLDVVAAFREGRTCSLVSSEACEFTAYSNCSSFSRCTYDGPNNDVPTNCKSGSLASSAPYHTIATYVVP
jgi:hypothetical protein